VTILAGSVAAGSAASNQVMPGVLGFLVVAAMGVALFFLLRSLNKQLRKVTPPPGTGKTGAEKTDGQRVGPPSSGKP